MENGRGKATKLAQELGCSTQTSREMVDCLRHRPASMIAQQVATFQVNPFQDQWNLQLTYFPFRVWSFISHKLLKTSPKANHQSDAYHCHHYKLIDSTYTQHWIRIKITNPEMMFNIHDLPSLWFPSQGITCLHNIRVLQHKIMQWARMVQSMKSEVEWPCFNSPQREGVFSLLPGAHPASSYPIGTRDTLPGRWRRPTHLHTARRLRMHGLRTSLLHSLHGMIFTVEKGSCSLSQKMNENMKGIKQRRLYDNVHATQSKDTLTFLLLCSQHTKLTTH